MEFFDKKSIISLQQDQISELEQKLQVEKEKLASLESMFETGIMNEKLLFRSTPCTLKKPFQYLHNMLSEEEIKTTRDFFQKATNDPMNTELSYKQLNVNSYLRLPELEAKLEKLFPNMRVFGTHWFKGDEDKAEYSGWHTGINLQKVFKGRPLLVTCWIPLQDLNSETGGQLWYYNGPRQVSLIDSVRNAEKENMLLQYVLLQNYDKHLEENKVTEDVKAGDCFVFREIMPHSVDRNSTGLREILSIRLVEKNAEIDEEFFQNLDKALEKKEYLFAETEGTISGLKTFCLAVRDAALAAKEGLSTVK